MGGLLALAAPVRAADTPALELVKTIPLPGVGGRFDHFALDLKGRRLFVAALGNDTLEVIDLAAGTRLPSVGGLRRPTGVLFLPQSGKLFVCSSGDGILREYDGAPLRTGKAIGGLGDADNIRYDARADLICLGYGSGALAVIRGSIPKTIASIALAGHPESFQLEKESARTFVNVPDARQIAVVDRLKRAIIAVWPMGEFRENFPMALDEAGGRLFVGCRRPARLVVLDTATGKRVADCELSGDIDDLFYDAVNMRLYASCGEGFIDVIGRRGPDVYERLERIPTAPGARTSFFSPDLGEFYLAVPERGGRSAEIRVFRVH